MTSLATRGAVLQFDHVSKSYDVAATRATNAPHAVNDPSLTIPAGNVCILVGLITGSIQNFFTTK